MGSCGRTTSEPGGGEQAQGLPGGQCLEGAQEHCTGPHFWHPSPTPSPTCTQETQPCTWTPSVPHTVTEIGSCPRPWGELQCPQGRGGPHQRPHRRVGRTSHILSGTGPSSWASERGAWASDSEARRVPFPLSVPVSWPQGSWAGAAHCGKAGGSNLRGDALPPTEQAQRRP